MIEWLTFFSTVATLVLAGVAVAALRESMQQTRESRRQFLENQRQAQESLEASQRPFLHPVGDLEVVVNDDGNRLFDFDHLDNFAQTVTIKNGGAGIAFNVRGVLVQSRVESDLAVTPRLRSFVLSDPLPVGGTAEQPTYAGPFSFGWDTAIDNDPSNTLAAPTEVIARLTITYQDIFGHTHASQFDCIRHRVTEVLWVFHTFQPKVSHDIASLAHEYDQRNARNQAAFISQIGTTWRG